MGGCQPGIRREGAWRTRSCENRLSLEAVVQLCGVTRTRVFSFPTQGCLQNLGFPFTVEEDGLHALDSRSVGRKH